jgi:hypothetical protein
METTTDPIPRPDNDVSWLAKKRLTLPAAALLAGVSNNTVKRWTETGVRGVVLPTVADGGRRYILEEVYLRFLNDMRDSRDWGS